MAADVNTDVHSNVQLTECDSCNAANISCDAVKKIGCNSYNFTLALAILK